ncbi:hypothetical protein ATCV1_z695R [Acanthocystis turfacea chlorella virus 1]|uniref:Uncharacterized protein z695R n=1 Tax=Chlorovirus heliozoae TaxID=322019 RepID=A7K9V5_9PHYC|nr:hypothetical protein ATCV1_z695R [Acanthocystis turfacea chlorella virus 1]ABT16829.1 hypothetical protein ATCV1_z695R [Acanthocystis turfacea chlorella virus 1]
MTNADLNSVGIFLLLICSFVLAQRMFVRMSLKLFLSMWSTVCSSVIGGPRNVEARARATRTRRSFLS